MTKLPLDVLYHFIEFIDHPRDLLSLALAARALYAIIVPRHIEYRRISCRRSSKHLWEHLLDTPYDACSRIRYLDISRSRGRTKIPRACIAKPEWNSRSLPSRGHGTRDDDPDATFEAFIQALSKMVNLKAFKFEVGDTAGISEFSAREKLGKIMNQELLVSMFTTWENCDRSISLVNVYEVGKSLGNQLH